MQCRHRALHHSKETRGIHIAFHNRGRREGMKLGIFFLFVLFSIHSICEGMESTAIKNFKPLLDAEWRKMESKMEGQPKRPPGVFWDYVISPPFPSIWPPDKNSCLYYYAYAAGHDLRGGLADGIHVSAPWGRAEVEIGRRTSLKFKPLASKIKTIGIQGVRPISKDELAIYEGKESAETYLGTLTTLPDENEQGVIELKKYYCTWCTHNGVIVEEIRRHHQQFFQWLGCE